MNNLFNEKIYREDIKEYPNERVKYVYFTLVDKITKRESMMMCRNEVQKK